MRAAILGAKGRMGRACARIFAEAGETPACLVDVRSTAAEGGDAGGVPSFAALADVPAALACDCVVDFSSPAALDGLLAFAAARRCPAVLATTGYTTAELERIARAAADVPLFVSRNMSLGAGLLEALAERLSRALCPAFDVEIVETHHRDKQDAPSGTALALADAVQRGGGGDRYIYDRRARGARAPGEIGIHALRGGSVTGMHELHFLGQGEQLTLTHIAEDRALFARGALAAARFLIGRPPGLYGMRDLARKMLENG